MQTALDLMYYILQSTLTFLFSAYLFDGVSVGMILICSFIFTILLRYLLAIPRIRVGGRPVNDKED